jgi:exonuclease SbcD
LKVLHTSDWHLGRTLYGKRRYAEHEQFLDWLIDALHEHEIDLLVIAGDIFDTSTPSNRAQELYYKFLSRIPATGCRHVVIIAGNHDSPSLLDAPGRLLDALNIHVVGSVCEHQRDEVIVLKQHETIEALVCAVPFLRDRDIRTASPGEDLESRQEKLLQGIQEHYETVISAAKQIQDDCPAYVPIIATGHLFAAGGRTAEKDGVRELYVGSLAHVSADLFPSSIDYLALGHLHVSQSVGGKDNFRYSGSPIPMGFGEARQKKLVNIVTLAEEHREIESLEVPRFQELEHVTGTLEQITGRIEDLLRSENCVWIEVEYTGNTLEPALRETIDALTEGSPIEVLRITDRAQTQHVLTAAFESESLSQLDIYEVFDRCLEANAVPEEQKNTLRESYRDIVVNLEQQDINAE